jgi:hypothetical protein
MTQEGFLFFPPKLVSQILGTTQLRMFQLLKIGIADVVKKKKTIVEKMCSRANVLVLLHLLQYLCQGIIRSLRLQTH